MKAIDGFPNGTGDWVHFSVPPHELVGAFG
jgi:hypothetical protein